MESIIGRLGESANGVGALGGCGGGEGAREIGLGGAGGEVLKTALRGRARATRVCSVRDKARPGVL